MPANGTANQLQKLGRSFAWFVPVVLTLTGHALSAQQTYAPPVHVAPAPRQNRAIQNPTPLNAPRGQEAPHRVAQQQAVPRSRASSMPNAGAAQPNRSAAQQQVYSRATKGPHLASPETNATSMAQRNPIARKGESNGGVRRLETVDSTMNNSVRSIDSTEWAVGSGVQRVSRQQEIDDPFKDEPLLNSDVGFATEHVSQTPASPETRPKAMPSSSFRTNEPQSVLGIRDEETLEVFSEDLPSLQLENRGQSVPSRFMGMSSPKPLRNFQEEDNSANDFNQNDQDAPRRAQAKSCDDFRQDLLGVPITSIALDMSPPPNTKQAPATSLYRDWTDISGNVVASGTLVDLRRGYVIIQGKGGLQKISYARLCESDIAAVANYWQIPSECFVSHDSFAGRCWEPQTVTWYASSLCHKPLYFENVQLERYGHSAGPVMGPFRAAAHFFGSVALFPYHTAINPPNECQYALGYYRPGNCAPWLVDPFPISGPGLVRQTSFVTGMWFLF